MFSESARSSANSVHLYFRPDEWNRENHLYFSLWIGAGYTSEPVRTHEDTLAQICPLRWRHALCSLYCVFIDYMPEPAASLGVGHHAWITGAEGGRRVKIFYWLFPQWMDSSITNWQHRISLKTIENTALLEVKCLLKEMCAGVSNALNYTCMLHDETDAAFTHLGLLSHWQYYLRSIYYYYILTTMKRWNYYVLYWKVSKCLTP